MAECETRSGRNPGSLWEAKRRVWAAALIGRPAGSGFIEILEERAITYGIELNKMPRALNEVLVDKAAKWFQTSGLRDVPWGEFRKKRS